MHCYRGESPLDGFNFEAQKILNHGDTANTAESQKLERSMCRVRRVAVFNQVWR